MSLPNSPQGSAAASRPSWQDQLSEHCRRTKLPTPIFNIVSDRRGTYPIPLFFSFTPSTLHRLFTPPKNTPFPFPVLFFRFTRLALPATRCRDTNCPCVGNVGGRTAWSSTVSINTQNFSARYWYDGQYINNAKEDAAEVALKLLNQQPRASTIYPGQIDSRQTTGYGRGAGGV
ncbi:hypothetical protein N7509_005820 [Penicillium cosmopolitanum]|uniref:DRBM domain-containing protein n=1 Tax=Penicillium cosmopolitanum TaxID=1131564 RepID=A0A9W9W360_9EURO|nr:uncharacterized protein N7509_005820 [Penicillium cosmopolitanum]KAJ5397707.1 hypothetical protein N7509_005820 [Penicillium cosmopolitanum]